MRAFFLLTAAVAAIAAQPESAAAQVSIPPRVRLTIATGGPGSLVVDLAQGAITLPAGVSGPAQGWHGNATFGKLLIEAWMFRLDGKDSMGNPVLGNSVYHVLRFNGVVYGQGAMLIPTSSYRQPFSAIAIDQNLTTKYIYAGVP